MSVKVNNEISWQEQKGLVERRLNKLAMCKRGAVETDINNQLEKAGKQPTFTKEEREKIAEGLAKKIQKSIKKPTITQIRKAIDNGNVVGIMRPIEKKIEEVRQAAFIHPDLEPWRQKIAVIKEQKEGRLAQLDADFQDAVDEFILGGKDLSYFKDIYEKLEQSDW